MSERDICIQIAAACIGDDYKGPRFRATTVRDVQVLFDEQGGYRETGRRVAKLGFLDPECSNVAAAFDAEGVFIASWAWQPTRMNGKAPNDGLVIVG